MKRMEEPGVVMGQPAKVEEAPKNEAAITRQEALARSDDRGGVRIEEAVKRSPDPVEDASILMADAVRKDLDEKMDMASAKVEVKENTSDLPEITARIKQLRAEEAAVKGGSLWTKLKNSWSSGKNRDTIELLQKGGAMVARQQDRFKMYKEAVASGQVELALEFVEALGAGRQVKIENGEIVSIGLSSKDGILNQ